jgi:hypothetical protein
MKVVMHEQVKSVGDVDAWLNANGKSLSEVQITYTYNPRGSKYTIFYEEEVDSK